MPLSREEIQRDGVRPLPTRDVPVPEFAPADARDVTVRVRALREGEYEELQSFAVKANDLQTVTARYLIKACVGPDGGPVFSEVDLPWLQHAPAGACERLYRAILDVSGLTQRAQEEVEKNLKTRTGAPAGGAGSSS